MLLSCGRGGDEPLRLEATIMRPPNDTIRFALPASAFACDDGRSLLLQAASPLGNGMLIRLRYGDSLRSAAYPIVTPGDSVTQGAAVAVRYTVRDAAHAFSVDSGAVAVQRSGGAIGARVAGSGLDGGIRTVVTAAYANVPRAADTVACHYAP